VWSVRRVPLELGAHACRRPVGLLEVPFYRPLIRLARGAGLARTRNMAAAAARTPGTLGATAKGDPTRRALEPRDGKLRNDAIASQDRALEPHSRVGSVIQRLCRVWSMVPDLMREESHSNLQQRRDARPRRNSRDEPSLKAAQLPAGHSRPGSPGRDPLRHEGGIA
jgi:hypothetical protein